MYNSRSGEPGNEAIYEPHVSLIHVSLIHRGPFQPGNHAPCLVTWCLEYQDAIKIQSMIFAQEYRMLISDHFSKDAADTPDINWGGVVL